MVTKNCEHSACGNAFKARLSEHKRGGARYCSKSCKAQAQAERTTTTTEEDTNK